MLCPRNWIFRLNLWLLSSSLVILKILFQTRVNLCFQYISNVSLTGRRLSFIDLASKVMHRFSRLKLSIRESVSKRIWCTSFWSFGGFHLWWFRWKAWRFNGGYEERVYKWIYGRLKPVGRWRSLSSTAKGGRTRSNDSGEVYGGDASGGGVCEAAEAFLHEGRVGATQGFEDVTCGFTCVGCDEIAKSCFSLDLCNIWASFVMLKLISTCNSLRALKWNGLTKKKKFDEYTYS